MAQSHGTVSLSTIPNFLIMKKILFLLVIFTNTKKKNLFFKIRAPPATFPRAEGKVQKISLPEDVYVKKFFQRHPDSLYHDDIQYAFSFNF